MLSDSAETSSSKMKLSFIFEKEEPRESFRYSCLHGYLTFPRVTTRFPWRAFAYFRRAAKVGRLPPQAKQTLVLFPSRPQAKCPVLFSSPPQRTAFPWGKVAWRVPRKRHDG